MDFSISVNFITGVMLGIEFSTEEDSKYMVLDLFIARLVFGLHPIE
jgi:hypothetical protein